MSPSMIVVAFVALVVMYVKGYLGNPLKSKVSSKSEDLGREFLKALQLEAQEEIAALIAGKMKEDVKAKLQAPFGVTAPDAPKPDPK